MRTRPVLFWFVLAASIAVHSPAQVPGGGGDANPGLKTNGTSLAKWQEMRFGMFIHWGPVTLRGTEIGWSRGPDVPIADYDSLYREFDPVLFNAASWIGTAKAAGMKYLVIVTKHHDGFCMWDTKYTDYKITSGPFRRDVVKELSDECARQGVMFCTYYSILDWHHPDYTTRYGGDTRPVLASGMDRYRTYLKNQVRELVSGYHSNLLWFDGQWEGSWTHTDGMELYAYARGLNAALLINNRVDKGRGRPARESDTVSYAGDFGTPEQEIGGLDNAHPWESCITIGKQWAWRPNDTLKTLKECIHILAKTAGGGGNLLLNISPMPDGRFEQRQIDILNGIGSWLTANGESIYGTKGGPYRSASWLASTYKENRIYVHLLTLPMTEVRLPVLPGRSVKSARLLGSGEIRLTLEDGKLRIALPAKPIDTNDTVIVLELDGPAGTIAPLDVPAISLN
jgi:alpha-L-fucosidase